MPRGYTLVWSGWENNLGPLDEPDGDSQLPRRDQPPTAATITGPSYEYIVTGGASFGLAYAAASLDTSKATLTHRVHLDDVPQPVAAWVLPDCTTGVCWRYVGETSIGLVNAATGAR